MKTYLLALPVALLLVACGGGASEPEAAPAAESLSLEFTTRDMEAAADAFADKLARAQAMGYPPEQVVSAEGKPHLGEIRMQNRTTQRMDMEALRAVLESRLSGRGLVEFVEPGAGSVISCQIGEEVERTANSERRDYQVAIKLMTLRGTLSAMSSSKFRKTREN